MTIILRFPPLIFQLPLYLCAHKCNRQCPDHCWWLCSNICSYMLWACAELNVAFKFYCWLSHREHHRFSSINRVVGTMSRVHSVTDWKCMSFKNDLSSSQSWSMECNHTEMCSWSASLARNGSIGPRLVAPLCLSLLFLPNLQRHLLIILLKSQNIQFVFRSGISFFHP